MSDPEKKSVDANDIRTLLGSFSGDAVATDTKSPDGSDELDVLDQPPLQDPAEALPKGPAGELPE